MLFNFNKIDTGIQKILTAAYFYETKQVTGSVANN